MFSRGSIGRAAIAVLPIAAGTWVHEPAATVTGSADTEASATRRLTAHALCSGGVDADATGTRRHNAAALVASLGISTAVATRRRPALAVALAALELTAIAIRRRPALALASGSSSIVAAPRFRFLRWADGGRLLAIESEQRRFVVANDNRRLAVPPGPEFEVWPGRRLP